MDIDLEFDKDHIRDFLRSKLEQIKASNVKLEESLRRRREVLAKCHQPVSSEVSIKLDGVWKKIVNSKYVLGVGFRNESDSEVEGLKVHLAWNSRSPLDYNFYIVSDNERDFLQEGFILTNAIKKFGQMVITLDVPNFADQLLYTITGTCSFLQNHKKVTVMFPSIIQLIPQDVSDDSVIVPMTRMTVDDVLACAVALEKHEFVMKGLFQSVLENDCCLSKIRVPSNKTFLLTCNLCSSLDGSLLEVSTGQSNTITYLNIFCRNEESLTGLVHYLHRQLTDVAIVPKRFYSDLNVGDAKELLRKSLSAEMDFLERNMEEDAVKLRTKVADLEHQTDILVARMQQNKS